MASIRDFVQNALWKFYLSSPIKFGNDAKTSSILNNGTLEADNDYQFAEGAYNKSNKATERYGSEGNTLHSIGMGTEDKRKNAMETMQNGDIYIKGIGNYDGTETNAQDYSIKPIQQTLVQSESVLKMVTLTSDEYEALEKKDPLTLYLIKDGATIEYIDLGLTSGNLWGSANIGATCGSTAESWYGDYYSWGEVETKPYYDTITYKYIGEYIEDEDEYGVSKYVQDPYWALNGITDNLAVLVGADDVVSMKEGGLKRMPTKEDIQELLDETTSTWVTNYNGISGLNGRTFTGENGNVLFIPAAGFHVGSSVNYVGSNCNLWSSNLNQSEPYNAYLLNFNSLECNLYANGRCNGFSVRPIQPHPYAKTETVDLGLASGNLWSTANVGATNDNYAYSWYGNYYAWGEIETKNEYLWTSYKYANGANKLTKYCPTDKSSYWDGSGSPDNILTLERKDDIGSTTYGPKWSIPTKEGIGDLIRGTTNEWVENYRGITGLNGRIFTSKANGNQMFIPAAGWWTNSSVNYVGSYCYLWSRSLYSTTPDNAYYLDFSSSECYLDANNRYYGFSARPVLQPQIQYIDLGLPSGIKWATHNIGATNGDTAESWYGIYLAWGEDSAKSDYRWETYKYANGDYNKLTKYCPANQTDYWDGAGSPDNILTLQSEDDIATLTFGSDYKMPTKEQIEELINSSYTTQSWVENYQGIKGLNGRIFTSKANGNQMFIPAAGYRAGSSVYGVGSSCLLWSRSLYSTTPNYAYYLDFYSSGCGLSASYRYYGFSARPVLVQ